MACFVCNTSLVQSSSSNVVPISARALQKIEQKIELLRTEIQAHQKSLLAQSDDYAAALAELRPLVARRHDLTMRIEQLNAQLPVATDDPQTPLLADLEAERLELATLAEKRADLGVKYKRQIDKLTLEMSALENDLGARLASSRYYAIEPLRQRARRTPQGPYYRQAHVALGGLVLGGMVSVEDFKAHPAVRDLQFEGLFRPTMKGVEVARVMRETITGGRLYRFLLDMCLASCASISKAIASPIYTAHSSP